MTENGTQLKILICDDSVSFGIACASTLRNQGFYTYVRPSQGKIVLHTIQETNPDVVVFPASLQKLNILDIINHLPKNKRRPLFLIISSGENNTIKQEILRSGISYFVQSPTDFYNFGILIRELNARKIAMEQCKIKQNLDVLITNMMHQIEIPTNLKGYLYFRTAVLESVDNSNMLENVTSLLYPTIAERHHTTASRVERSIRHAIQVTWNRGTLKCSQEFFDFLIVGFRKRPTNSELISLFVDEIRMHLFEENRNLDA